MTRPIDKQATKLARARHAAGEKVLREIFGSTSEGHAASKRARRVEQGHGGSFTREHWTRLKRRRLAKAQRLSRRRNRT